MSKCENIINDPNEIEISARLKCGKKLKGVDILSITQLKRNLSRILENAPNKIKLSPNIIVKCLDNDNLKERYVIIKNPSNSQ